MNIEDTKRFREEIYVAFLLVIVAFTSFYFGRLSVINEVKADRGEVKIVSDSSLLKEIGNIDDIVIDGNFVASINGTKYYPKECTASNRIKEENKVYFNTEKEAISQGYERTSQCK